MNRSPPNLRRRAALGAVLVACCVLPAALAQAPAEPADPVPINRVNVTREHLAREMEKRGLTALARLSPDDFDRRLGRARTAARAAPQLVEARYFGAELSGDALVGKAKWHVLYGGSGAALLPLQPLTVALRQPRFDTREAVVAEFEGQGAALVVEGPGEHTVNLDWSARREPGADGVQFQLGLPPCPVASLELDLPANLVVAADGLPVTGPLPAEKPDRKLWRVTFSRRPALALTLRRRPEPAEPRVLLAGPVVSRLKLAPDVVEADFTFDHMKVLSGEFRELTCALDPSLRPYEVTAPEIDGWQVRPPAAAGAPALLSVRLREPLLSGSLVVRCFAPLGSGDSVPWTAPGVRLLRAVPGGETLFLHLDPGVSLDAWQPGAFRLLESNGDADGQTLKLLGGLIDETGDAKAPASRPTARVRARGTEFRAREVALWKVDPQRVSLLAEITYEVLRGRLFRLALEVPPGYDVQQVETSPAAALRNWQPKNDRGNQTLVVDLTQPLAPGTPLRLRLLMRPSVTRAGALSWPIPDLVPLGASSREGGLAIDFDERRFEGQVSGAAMTTAPPDEPGPWGNKAPNYYCPYRGLVPRGRLELRPLPPRPHDSRPPVPLAPRGAPPGDDRGPATIDRAVLTTAAEPTGRLLHLFRFQVRGWREPSLPLRVSAGARLLSVKVDGLWVENVPPVEEDGGLRIDLPVPGRAGAVEGPPRRYEVIYATDGSGRGLWARLESPAPALPLPPLAFERRWRLPPGMVPLRDDRVRALPSPDAEPDERARGPKDFGALSSLVLRPLAIEDWQVRQRQEVSAAAQAGRPPAGRDFTLGEALERVACDTSTEHDPLVIDALALEEVGLTPATPLAEPGKESVPFWEALGLVHVACRPAPLLTTRARRDTWQRAGVRESDAVPPSVEAAVAEAAATGHDTSGRFVWALAWARGAAPTTRRTAGAGPFDAATPGWTEWEPLAGVADAGELTAVRRDPVRAAGIGLMVGLVALAWGLRRQTARRKLALLLVWLAAAGGGLFWLPASLHSLAWWPLVAGTALALSWYLWSATRSTEPKAAGSSRLAARAASAAALLALVVGGARLAAEAVPPAAGRATVLVVAGPSEAPDQQVVLVPRELLKQIDALATVGRPHAAALAGATYEGKLAGDDAEFEAKLAVHSFEDGPVTLALPFADVRLQDDALLDGARAFLVAAPPGQTGFLLKLDKPGAHVLVFHFRASVSASGSERELRFRVPRAPQSELVLALPAGATFFQAVARQGSLVPSDAGAAAAGSRYAVELGRVDAPLLFRWHQPAGPAPAPVMSVREGYLWGLRPDTANLTAVLHYTVTKGAPTSLAVAVPEALAVQGVELRPAEVGRPAPRLESWRVESANGKRQLRLDLAAPLTGRACVVAHLVPRRPLAALATLSVPTPIGAVIADGFLAVREDGIEARVAGSGRLRGPYPAAVGARELKGLSGLWQAAGEGSLPALTALYGLQREPGGEPILQVRLGVSSPAVRGSQEVAWRVGERQANLRAVAYLSAAGGDLPLVEWEVPTDVTVTRVGGRDGREPVRHWSRFGNRVQAWLDRTPAADEVVLEGWKNLAPEKEGARFGLPAVRLLSSGSGTALVRVTAPAEFSLTALDTHTLWPLPDSRASERELSYAPRGPSYGGQFHVRHVTAGAEARVLTTAEAVAGRLTFTAHVEYRPEPGGGRGVQVRLRRWDGEVRFEAPTAIRRSEAHHAGGEQTWVIDLPAGATALLTLSGTMPLPATGVAAPDITVSGAARPERWLAVGGSGLTADEPRHLAVIPARARGLRELPAAGRAEAARLQADGGTLWKIGDAGWALRLLPRARPAGEAPVRVALTECVSAVVDGRHWFHEARIWLTHEDNTDLEFTLPDGARVLGASVDGLDVTPLSAAADRLRVPLPSAGGARRVLLRWAFDPEAEPLDRPVLQRPRLHDAADGPVVWTVHVPAAYTTAPSPEERRGRLVPSSPALLDLARAEAQYRLSEFLASKTGPLPASALAVVQRRLYRFCRYAEAGRVLTAQPAGAVNLQGQRFEDWLQQLKDRNGELARRDKFEELRARAEREATEAGPPADESAAMQGPTGAGRTQVPGPRGEALPERGTPLRWLSGPSADAPRLALRPLADRQTRRAAGASLLLAMLLVLVWAVAQFTGVLAWVRAFWPEQLALLGCVGWQTYGPTLALLFLIVLGVVARLLFLGRRLLVLLHRPPSDSGGGGGSGSGMVVEPRPSGA